MLDDKDRKWLWESMLWAARKSGPNPDDYPSAMRRLQSQYRAITLTIQMLIRCLANIKLEDIPGLDATVPPDAPDTKPPICRRWRRWLNYTAIVVVIILITLAFGVAIKLPATQHPEDQEQMAAVKAELARLAVATKENADLMANKQNATIDWVERIGELQRTATFECLVGKAIFRHVTQITPETITLELPDKQGKPLILPHGLTKEEVNQLSTNLSPSRK